MEFYNKLDFDCVVNSGLTSENHPSLYHNSSLSNPYQWKY